MAAFFAGAAKVPLPSLVMVSEMTMGYGLLVPLMLTNAIAFLLMPRSLSIYEQQVNARVDSGAHEGEFFYDVLERIRVEDALTQQEPPVVMRRDTHLSEILQALVTTRQQAFPILNANGSLFGVIDVHDIRAALANPNITPGLVVAQDLCGHASPVVLPDESLASALRKFRGTMLEELPVVRTDDSQLVTGMLGRKDISTAYHDYLYGGTKS
jgi:CIC family chloride channel protein